MPSHRCFTNRECEYYPCHDLEEINCLFCFCPLYNTSCYGNAKWTAAGIKDCSECDFPHRKENYQEVLNRLTAL